jgi:hypothetical protein
MNRTLLAAVLLAPLLVGGCKKKNKGADEPVLGVNVQNASFEGKDIGTLTVPVTITNNEKKNKVNLKDVVARVKGDGGPICEGSTAIGKKVGPGESLSTQVAMECDWRQMEGSPIAIGGAVNWNPVGEPDNVNQRKFNQEVSVSR